jgi:NAD(P)H-flavin reductase
LQDGQYIFLQSPPISTFEWHPFTISSAPEEKTVTVHIRVSGEGSWTRELCAYIAAMGPKGKPYFALDRQGPQGKLQGKSVAKHFSKQHSRSPLLAKPLCATR